MIISNFTSFVVSIASMLFIFLIPGLAMSYLFIDKYMTDVVMRIAIAIGLSIIIVPLILIIYESLGNSMDRKTIIMILSAFTAITGGVYLIKQKMRMQ